MKFSSCEVFRFVPFIINSPSSILNQSEDVCPSFGWRGCWSRSINIADSSTSIAEEQQTSSFAKARSAPKHGLPATRGLGCVSQRAHRDYLSKKSQRAMRSQHGKGFSGWCCNTGFRACVKTGILSSVGTQAVDKVSNQIERR